MMSSNTSKQPTHPSTPSETPLPPGMVLGPDGKPCKVCTAFRNWQPRTQSQKPPQASPGQQTSTAAAALSSVAVPHSQTQTSTSTTPIPVRPTNCPADVEQLGNATWTFLHTTAAYYPEKPSMPQRVNMLSLLRALPVLYPCSSCAQHLGENLKTHPPDVSGRAALSRWLCEQHNEVNERLGKERFECTVKKLDERWKDGPSDGSCD